MQVVFGSGRSTTTYAHDAEDRLTDAVTGSEVTTYTSDLYGRRTVAVSSTEGTTTYTWDPLGHLVRVASQVSTSTYEYGPTGMREKITVTSGGTTRTTQCVYDGQVLVAEHDSDGTTYRYLWGPDRTPLAVEVSRPGQAAAVYSYHADAFGSVVAIRDATGFPVAEYRYDAFGALSVGGSWSNDPAFASRNPIRYRSYYYDAATALYYLPARYYEPETARFLSPDPAPPSAGDPLSLNAYAYCQGDPVNAEDPSGAIADTDGNGRIDSWDTASAMATVSKGVTRRFWEAKSRGLYADAHGDADGVSAAIAEIVQLGEGKRIAAYYEDECWGLALVVGVIRGVVTNYGKIGNSAPQVLSSYSYYGFCGGVSLTVFSPTMTRGDGYAAPGVYHQGMAGGGLNGAPVHAEGNGVLFEAPFSEDGTGPMNVTESIYVILPSDYTTGWTLPDGTNWGYPW